ncbi:Zinc finger protein 670 [Plecturocebus cupreus]
MTENYSKLSINEELVNFCRRYMVETRHENKVERKCGKTFSQILNLNLSKSVAIGVKTCECSVHIMSHSGAYECEEYGEKLYECKRCQKTFISLTRV